MARQPLPFALAAVTLVVVACGGSEPPPRPPLPPPPPADPPILATVAQACARVSACTHAREGSNFRDPGACVDWWLTEDREEPLRKCFLAAKSCADVATCSQGGGDARAATFCQRPGVVSGCDGDRLVSCGEDDAHPATVVDCAAFGASCRDVKSASGIVVRACAAAAKCAAGVVDARCDGPGAATSCRDGAYERVACRPGTACQEYRDESGEAGASCEPVSSSRERARCDGRAYRRCEQDRLVECENAGRVSKATVTDCVGIGLRCRGIGPRAGCVVATDLECDKAMLPKCDGSSLTFCAAGRLEKIACESLGFSSCAPAGKGAIAACAEPSLVGPPSHPK
jgi:hypothetical protein